MANDPAILLADEPTGNLDPETANRVFDAMLALAREKKLTALVATHNAELAARLDRVIHLDAGVIT